MKLTYANPENTGILVQHDDSDIPLYVDSGQLFVDAQAGLLGPVAPYEPLPETPEHPDIILQIMRDVIQSHMDTKAQERNYDGILSLCTYATSTNPKFAAEGQAGVAWRDACWARGYEIMAEVQEGLREIPTVEELLAELPVFHWPDEEAA